MGELLRPVAAKRSASDERLTIQLNHGGVSRCRRSQCIEHITTFFLPRDIDFPLNSLLLQKLEKALGYGVGVAEAME